MSLRSSTQQREIRKMTESDNHGKVVQRYIQLSKQFNSPHFLDRLSHVSTLVVQPIGHVVFWICFYFFPDLYTYFGGDIHVSFLRFSFYLLSSIQVVWGCLSGWMEVLEYYGLATKIMIWKLLTIRLNAPRITISSQDQNHDLFKWAAGALFLFNNI
jgi:hypothetical protein